MRQIHTPDLYIRLRNGGVLELSVCREDKIEILRSVFVSLHLDHSATQRAQNLISEIESARSGGVWGNITRLVKAPHCEVCQSETYFGRRGKFPFCKDHAPRNEGEE